VFCSGAILFDGAGLKKRGFQNISAVLGDVEWCWLTNRACMFDGAITAPVADMTARSDYWDRGRLAGRCGWWRPNRRGWPCFFLVHARAWRLRPRVGRNAGGGIFRHQNDPFAVSSHRDAGSNSFRVGDSSLSHVALEFGPCEDVLGTLTGVIGGRLVVLALN